MGVTVINQYDSHVHWRLTGERDRQYDLSKLKSDLSVLDLQKNERYFVDGWWRGFGWDQNNWERPAFPSRLLLDKKFGQDLVCFVRADWHAVWVNTAVLRKVGLWKKLNEYDIPGGRILLDHRGYPTGVLIDKAADIVRDMIPELSQSQIEEQLLHAQKVFHKNGFTHIRDLTCDKNQFFAQQKIEKSGLLQLAVEQYFHITSIDELSNTVRLAQECQQEPSQFVRVKGIKLFLDGALGSEGAWLSQPYCQCTLNHGIKIYSEAELAEILEFISSSNLEPSVHVIGDQALDVLVNTSLKLYEQKKIKQISIEHAQMIRDDSLKILKKIPATLYMQPCHWLSDKKWAKQKTKNLFSTLFRWRDLEDNNIPFYFGSDSPIEPPSLINNQLALVDAESNGIKATKNKSEYYQSHPDKKWVPNCQTEWQGTNVSSVTFNSTQVYRN